MTTIPGYFGLTDAALHLGISKQNVVKAGKREGWKREKVGNVALFHTEDIYEYRDLRYRTQLVKKLGWSGRGLYRDEDIDISCPICEGFAVEWPAPPQLAEKYLCLNGHEGEL